MAKKSSNSKSSAKGQQISQKPDVSQNSRHRPKGSSGSLLDNPYFPYFLIFLFTVAIYFNTLWNNYALDDSVMIWQNKFTLKGLGGIKDLFTHDSLTGFWGEKGSQMVSGGRYRPLSLLTFALEVNFFGLNPRVSHGVNVLLFASTCLLLYHLLLSLIPRRKDTPFYLSIPFISTIIFAGHPIHTEVVANIKGRDEIMGLLFSLLALFFALNYIRQQKPLQLMWGTLCFFLALLSKENAITFIAIIPLTYFFFTKAKLKDYALTVSLFLIPFLVFLYLRSTYTNSRLTTESPEILNNPFAYLPKTTDGFLQHYATVIMTFLLYIKLLIFPYPLTHDYYYNQIPFINIGNPLFFLSLLANGGLLIYALLDLRKKTLPAYAILFYFIAFSIVSNLFFTVGILMNERFVYMPSIGYCLLIAWLLSDKLKLSGRIMTSTLTVILLLYSVQTISRNRDWEDDVTLVLSDFKTSTKSTKVKMTAGSILTTLAEENFDSLRRSGRLQYVADQLDMKGDVATVPDSTIKRVLLERAMIYQDSSLTIYPTRGATWLNQAATAYKLKRPVAEVLRYYEKAQEYTAGGSFDALYYMGSMELMNNMYPQAKDNLAKAILLKPDDFQCRFYLALSYNYIGKIDSSVIWLKKSLDIKSTDPQANYVLGSIYSKQLNDPDAAIPYLSKAIEYSPNTGLYYDEMSTAYTKMRNLPKAEEYAIKAKQINGVK